MISCHATFYLFSSSNAVFCDLFDLTPFRFCVEFKLESRTSHCTVENRPHTLWMRYITEGFKVCVACEPPAKRNTSGSCQGDGHESDKYETIWFSKHLLNIGLQLYSFLLFILLLYIDFNVELIRQLLQLLCIRGICNLRLWVHMWLFEALTKT